MVIFPYSSPVGSFAANGYGLHDMAGNVWDWCWDLYGNYDTGSPSDPRGASSGGNRVIRGGSWQDHAIFCRVARRHDYIPSLTLSYIGFRVALSADPSARTAPIVTTGAAVPGDGAGTFTVSGSVTLDGGSPVTARGVVYDLVPEPTLTSAIASPSGAGTGDFSSTLTNLVLNATYYARAYATNALGTRYGGEITFKNAPATPVGFSVIPAGVFQMGDALDGIADAPVRQVTVSPFYMAQRETTKALWDEVRAWGISRGYTDLPVGGGKASNHPVQTVTWFDVIKWCNARSEKDGLEPVYTANDAVMRTGTIVPTANWTASGYRLPTEAEWEKAARGGLNGKRFPWGDTISHSQANYQSNSADAYDISPTRGFHPTYAVGSQPYTSPVGSFAANGYTLHDIAGNVWEWCWDWHGAYASGAQSDPRGVTSGSSRVVRGGGCIFNSSICRAAHRGNTNSGFKNFDLGFRVVRSYTPMIGQFVPTVITGTAAAGAAFDSFTVSGEVTTDGGIPVTRRGIVYGLTATPTLGTATDAPATGAGAGAFSSTLIGLSPETTYYARAYASSTVGTGYGAEITFKTASSTPVGFALIPAGAFQMGDALDGMSDAPVRTVNVSAFYMGKTEVTKEEWDQVRTWGFSRGYTDLAVGGGKASNHPVQTVSWWDVIKWCNARSEKDGIEPVYAVNGAVLRTGTTVPTVNWGAKGYRLPTEAEWEKAARGGLNGKRFPWGDTISHSQANYRSRSLEAYDVSPTRGVHPTYGVGSEPYTSPVDSFTLNGYELHDMAGNVYEWCWDWYGAYASGAQSDPKGGAAGVSRVLRSSSWGQYAIDGGRAADRYAEPPGNKGYGVGFRVSRSSLP